jgi:N-acetylmuramoyl-L-alanine amidase
MSRGVKQANFLVLHEVAMPSVLVEVGFLTNSNEESFLKGGKGKAHISDQLYKAFRDYKIEFER